MAVPWIFGAQLEKVWADQIMDYPENQPDVFGMIQTLAAAVS